MPRYNEMFELSVNDMELIETALRRTQEALWQDQLGDFDHQTDGREETRRQIQDLLGRLHNQKIFYRPKDGVYVGG